MNPEDEKLPANSEDAEREERKKTFSRRRLLQVGWTVPVIAAIELNVPKTVYAQGGSHFDYTDHADHTDHDDVPHVDAHQDRPWGHADTHQDAHVDTNHFDNHWDHTDAHVDGHNDYHQDWHIDFHGDYHDDFQDSHADSHRDSHGDEPHSDITGHDDHLDHIDS